MPRYPGFDSQEDAPRRGRLRTEERAHDRPRGIPEADASGPTTAGKIKAMTKDRGFGFIITTEGKEYFFHRSETAGTYDDLMVGDKVTFRPLQSPKGPRAQAVTFVP